MTQPDPHTPATFDREALYHRLDRERRARHKRWAQIAREVGIPRSTFTSLGQGNGIHIDALTALMAWLGETDLKPYMSSADGTTTSNEEQ